MTTERRKFRPFDVPVALERFLDGACLRIGDGETEGDVVEAGLRRVVGPSELQSRDFTIEICPTDEEFSRLQDDAIASARELGADDASVVLIARSPYLKFADIMRLSPVGEFPRSVRLKDLTHARAFDAIHHGCDLEMALILGSAIAQVPLRPHRAGTWLARVKFELRTNLDGVGFTILPLDDDAREKLKLPKRAMRYVKLDASPLETSSTSDVHVYVDHELLGRLNKSPRRSWARAFQDQLAVDVLATIAMAALSDQTFHLAEWSTLQDTLVGAVIAMIDGKPLHHVDHDRDALVAMLQQNPSKFLAQIEDRIDMRAAAKLIVGNG